MGFYFGPTNGRPKPQKRAVRSRQARVRLPERECFKPIAGYDGWYWVSNLGRVKSFKWGKERIRKLRKSKYGYLCVSLSHNNTMKTHSVHRLVLEAFVSPCPEDKVCNHKNGIKDDNKLENLEWVTVKENNHHAWNITKTARSPKKLYIGTNPKGERFKITDLAEFCKENNLTYTEMSRIANSTKKHKKHKGWGCGHVG